MQGEILKIRSINDERKEKEIVKTDNILWEMFTIVQEEQSCDKKNPKEDRNWNVIYIQKVAVMHAGFCEMPTKKKQQQQQEEAATTKKNDENTKLKIEGRSTL